MKKILKRIYRYFKGEKELNVIVHFTDMSTFDPLPMELPSGKLFFLDYNLITNKESDRLIDEKNRRLVNYKMSKFPNIKRDNELRYNQMANDQDYIKIKI